VRLEQLDNRQPVPLMALICGPELSFNSPIRSYTSGDASTARSMVILLVLRNPLIGMM
jgi:hypothetical protein